MRYRMVSLGCPKNLVDSEHMAGRLDKAGHTLSEEAEIVVVNTCAFISEACSESIETILDEAKRAKSAGTRLIVTGCLVERYGEELKKLLPEVDAFLGRGSYASIEELLLQGGFYGGRGAKAASCDNGPRQGAHPLAHGLPSHSGRLQQPLLLLHHTGHKGSPGEPSRGGGRRGVRPAPG